MNPSFFKEMPKFKTPEEELDYLRAHVKVREEQLIGLGQMENAGDNAVHEIISTYKTIPAKQLIHKDNLVKEKEAKEPAPIKEPAPVKEAAKPKKQMGSPRKAAIPGSKSPGAISVKGGEHFTPIPPLPKK